MNGPVDEYLDEMFDRLAGTGAAGRRTLAETEDHLRAAVADGVASGVAAEQAEHDAGARFGPVAGVTRELEVGHRRRRALGALSGGWLVAGLTVVGLGVTYLAATIYRGGQPWQYQSVVFVSTVPEGGDTAVSFYVPDPVQPRDALVTAVIVLLAGAVLLAGRAVLGRRSALPPPSRRFPVLAAVAFVLLGVVFAVLPVMNGLFSDFQGSGLPVATIAATVALLIAIGIGVWGLLRVRRSRVPVGGEPSPPTPA